MGAILLTEICSSDYDDEKYNYNMKIYVRKQLSKEEYNSIYGKDIVETCILSDDEDEDDEY